MTETEKLLSFETPSSTTHRLKIGHLADLFLLATLVVIGLLSALPYDSYETWSQLLFTTSLLLLASVKLSLELASGKVRPDALSVCVPLLALACFALLQSVVWRATPLAAQAAENWNSLSADPIESRRFAVRLLAYLSFGWLLSGFLKSSRALSKTLHTAAAVGVLSAAYGIVQYLLPPGVALRLFPYSGVDLAFGQFGNKNNFAFLMEMTLGLLLGFVAAGGAQRWRRLAYLSPAFLVWCALMLTHSRGAIVSTAALVCFLFVVAPAVKRASRRRRPQRPRRYLLYACGLPALALVLVYGVAWAGGDLMADGLNAIPNELRVAGESRRLTRAEIWNGTWRLFLDYPATGVGFGGYWVKASQYLDVPGDVVPYQAHNDYLELLASGGIVGAALGLWFVCAFVREVGRGIREADRLGRAARVGALAGVFAVGVHSTVDFGLHQHTNAVLLTVLLTLGTSPCAGVKAPCASARRAVRRRHKDVSANGS